MLDNTITEEIKKFNRTSGQKANRLWINPNDSDLVSGELEDITIIKDMNIERGRFIIFHFPTVEPVEHSVTLLPHI